jgi:hypothetical protein
MVFFNHNSMISATPRLLRWEGPDKLRSNTSFDGTTWSCVNFFMNKFRKHGFIDCDGRLLVHNSLPSVVRHD